ncbi:MAG TPA: DNA adenine methylase [Thermoguttaceae bacterium]|nr:DNA adenine methylase [Thermoguttaceae bacterium]
MSSPIKWHGGKHYLARRIVELMPPHVHYVEPYFGGGAVLLAKDPEGVSEVVNDIDASLTTFWSVLQSARDFPAFIREIQAVPFSEAEFRDAEEGLRSPSTRVELAVAFFVRCRQSLAGRMQEFATLSRRRTRRGMNEQVSAWLSAIEGLPEVHARLKRVAILCRDALDVIRQQDGPETLFYLDPPYWPDARTAKEVYRYEMTQTQHVDLLKRLSHIKGRFLLSGYRNPTYDRHAADWEWRRVDFDLPNNAAGGAQKRRMTECVWMNYKPEA